MADPKDEGVGELLGRLLDAGQREAARAARKGREILELRQLRADRDRMYEKLGREAFHLLDGGEIDHPGIRRGVERIKDVEAKIAALVATAETPE